jgi:alanine racemase
MQPDPSRHALLRIDLDALARNYRLLRSRAAPAECAAVVKANGYGLGVEPVAKRLLREGCQRFFVATLAEGRELRAIAHNAHIYIFEGAVEGGVHELAKLRLRPALNTLAQVERWRGHGPAALHIDTGMNRLGLSAADVATVAAHRELLEGIDLVMTHLACADEPGHPLNREQLERFAAARAQLPRLPTSIGNSAGTLIDAAYRGDVARPGIALYGGNPFSDRENPMACVATLTAPILQLRDIERPEAVGYGATYVASPPARIAVVGVGYADGYPRHLSNCGVVAIRGKRAPVVGRVSMDLILVDVGSLPRDDVRVGEPVELFGPTIGIDEVATAAGTISYEVLTGLGRRPVRDYVEAE